MKQPFWQHWTLVHHVTARGRFYKQMSGMVKETWLPFTTGTLMAPSVFLASTPSLHFQGVFQGAVKLLGKEAGVVGGEEGRRQQEGSLLHRPQQSGCLQQQHSGLGGPPSPRHGEVYTQGILPCYD